MRRRDGAARRGIALAGALAASALALAGCGVPGFVGSPGSPGDVGGVVTGEQADRIAHRVLTQDATIRSGIADAETRISGTYAGEGARAARGSVLLVSKGVLPKASTELRDVQVLANSRGVDYPRYLVASSTPTPGGLPWVHLLVATNAQTPYRLAMSAQVLPGAQINAFPGAADGTAVVSDGVGYQTNPVDLLRLYAEGLTTEREDAPYDADEFAGQVRTRAAAQQREYAAEADISVTHQLEPDPYVALEQLNGEALVFGTIMRTSDYAIKAGQQMAPTAIFSAFVPGRTALVQQARTATAQFLVFSLPKEGKAHLVAATEMVVGASGY